jgi:hypothetical protein
VSAIFDELAVQSGSESNSLSEVRRVAYLLDKVEFQKLVTKGNSLREMMTTGRTTPAQSSFPDVQDLQRWGYYTYDSNDPVQLRHIDEVLDTIGVIVKSVETHSVNIPVSHTQDHPVIVEGTLYPASNALLCQVINPSAGLIVAYDNITAQGMIMQSMCDSQRAPRLNHWSDIAYLQWLSKASTGSRLRYVLRYNVLNDLTAFAMTFMSSHNGLVLADWPGITYDAGSDEFNALLGSPNGRGVAYLLIQHQKQLGHKTVENITVFRRQLEVMLLFKIHDVRTESDLCSESTSNSD